MRYLILPASTNSQWDSVSHCLVPMTQEIAQHLVELADKLPSEFNMASVDSDSALFGTCEHCTIPSIVDRPTDWVDVDATLRYGEVRFRRNADDEIKISFVSFAKHTYPEDEYWAEIDLDSFVEITQSEISDSNRKQS